MKSTRNWNFRYSRTWIRKAKSSTAVSVPTSCWISYSTKKKDWSKSQCIWCRITKEPRQVTVALFISWSTLRKEWLSEPNIPRWLEMPSCLLHSQEPLDWRKTCKLRSKIWQIPSFTQLRLNSLLKSRMLSLTCFSNCLKIPPIQTILVVRWIPNLKSSRSRFKLNWMISREWRLPNIWRKESSVAWNKLTVRRLLWMFTPNP